MRTREKNKSGTTMTVTAGTTPGDIRGPFQRGPIPFARHSLSFLILYDK